jgi:hypothetical protein
MENTEDEDNPVVSSPFLSLHYDPRQKHENNLTGVYERIDWLEFELECKGSEQYYVVVVVRGA